MGVEAGAAAETGIGAVAGAGAGMIGVEAATGKGAGAGGGRSGMGKVEEAVEGAAAAGGKSGLGEALPLPFPFVVVPLVVGDERWDRRSRRSPVPSSSLCFESNWTRGRLISFEKEGRDGTRGRGEGMDERVRQFRLGSDSLILDSLCERKERESERGQFRVLASRRVEEGRERRRTVLPIIRILHILVLVIVLMIVSKRRDSYQTGLTASKVSVFASRTRRREEGQKTNS